MCRCQRPPALRYRFRSCPAASAQRKRNPARSSQPAGTEAEPGIHPGSTEPEEGPGSGSQGGQRAGGRAVRSPSANGTREAPALGRDPRLTLLRTPAGRSSSAAPAPSHKAERPGGPRTGMQPGPATQPRPGPGTARAQPLSAGRGPAARSWGHRGTEGSRRLPRCPTRSPGTSCGDRRGGGTRVAPAGPRRLVGSPRGRPRGGSAAAAPAPGADGPR